MRIVRRAFAAQNFRSGFTLVEVVVVVLILGILAAVVVPSVVGNGRDAILTATMQDVQAIEEAAYRYRALNGEWPSTTYRGNDPGDFEGHISSSVFRKEPPIGATGSYGWIWLKDFIGIEALICLVHSNPPIDLWQELDDLYDDGDLTAGDIYIYRTSVLFFIVEDI